MAKMIYSCCLIGIWQSQIECGSITYFLEKFANIEDLFHPVAI
jgi:hypothetical protein